MYKQFVLFSLLGLVLMSCGQNNKDSTDNIDGTSLEYVLNMVHVNPGEGETNSIYNDPEFIRERGYDGMVFQFYANCAITYDNYEEGIVAENSEARVWIEDQAEQIDVKLEKADAHGIDTYAFTDVFVAPKDIWDKYGKDMGQLETDFHGYGGANKNVRKPNIQYPVIQELLRAQVRGIFDRFPTLDGLVIRFGETYLHDTPHHMGGKPVRQGEEGVKDHVTLINLLREEVCEKLNKKLFYRTWDFGWMHTDPEVYRSITDQVTPHENLIFSIKHTKGDFQRNFPFNPTIGIGRHKQIVEVQCQREYEGKGAHPNYIAGSVINGFEEIEQNKILNNLSDLIGNPNFSGVWTWARGGGWKGPYISNELWCDLNAYVVSQWASDTTTSEETLFNNYANWLKLSQKDTQTFRQIALLSTKGVLLGRSSKITHINPWWIRDQFMGGITYEEFNDFTPEAWGKLNEDFKRIVEEQLVKYVLDEKRQAVDIWRDIEKKSNTISSGDENVRDYIKVSSAYGRIKYDIIHQAWTVMLKGLEGEYSGQYDVEMISQAKEKYDLLWEEFRTLKAENPQCATLYKPYSFMLGNNELHGEEGMEKTVNIYGELVVKSSNAR